MDKLFLRNFFIFLVILGVCSTTLLSFIISSNRSLDQTSDIVIRSQSIILEAEQLSAAAEAILAEQRGYLLTRRVSFLEDYKTEKKNAQNRLDTLKRLTAHSKIQTEHTQNLLSEFDILIHLLDTRTNTFFEDSKQNILNDVRDINKKRESISIINNSILRHEYRVLETQLKTLENQKNEYYQILIANVILGTVLLIIFNGFLLHAQRKRSRVEKELAEQKNHAKSDFLAHMSHEIRTPLTAISGVAEILSGKKEAFDQKTLKLIETLSVSSSTLKELVNDILDFSKIESGKIDLIIEPFSLNDLFNQISKIMILRAKQRHIAFEIYNKLPVDFLFCGDEKRVRQILINLVGNALKFTKQGAVKIFCEVECQEDQKFLRIDVSDTGIGIKPDDFDAIFKRFQQADATVSRKYGGTGLGLPISKNLAQSMGGDIYISSALGEGSTFSLLLPMSEKTESVNTKTKDILKKTSKNMKHDLQSKKVLIVEDYEGNIVIVSHILEDMGLHYDVAKNGLEALALYKKNTYDLVLMDVQMPEMDGFTATSAIRTFEKKKKRPQIPIIGMTAHALVGDRDKCIKAGMNNYLSKPLAEKTFIKEIHKFLKKA